MKCTAETNTICECRGKFVPSDSDSSTCKCDIGFGKNQRGTEMITQHCMQYAKEIVFIVIRSYPLPECEECEEGYFSKSINSRCEKWKVYVHCILPF